MDQPLIYIVSEDNDSPEDLQQHLTRQGLKVVRSVGRTEALRLFEAAKPDLAIIYSGNHDGGLDLEMLRLLRRQSRGAPVFLIVRESSEAKAIAALRAGAADYFKQPFSYGELLESIRRNLPAPRSQSPGEPSPPQAGETEPTFIGATPPYPDAQRLYRPGRGH